MSCPADDMVNIACCPDHGLHGARKTCFICEGEVEQVPMVRASVHQQLQEACRELMDAIWHMPGVHNPTWPVGAAAAKVKELSSGG